MSAATIQIPPRRKRFTRAEVEQMMDAGLFAGQRFELIDGDLIDKAGQNPPHAFSVSAVADWLNESFLRRVRTQLPIEVAKTDEQSTWPEPDVALLAAEPAARQFRGRHPRGNELLLVVEVSDATARQDLTIKRDIYARAEVPEYWVLDIVGRKLVVHRQPSQGRYEEVVTMGEAETATLASGGAGINLARLLP